jgi:hypothetical protein
MKLKEAIWWLGALLASLALVWFIAGNSLLMQKVFAPAFEQVRRETFEESKAYRDGMAQEIAALQIEYIKADEKIKPALASAIKHKAAGIPENALPYNLQIFIKELP